MGSRGRAEDHAGCSFRCGRRRRAGRPRGARDRRSALPSGDHATLTTCSPRKLRIGPPSRGIDRTLRHGPPPSQISDPSPLNPTLRTGARASSTSNSSAPDARLRNSPVPIWPTKISNGPSRSETKATNLPSGEIAASNSDPSKSVILAESGAGERIVVPAVGSIGGRPQERTAARRSGSRRGRSPARRWRSCSRARKLPMAGGERIRRPPTRSERRRCGAVGCADPWRGSVAAGAARPAVSPVGSRLQSGSVCRIAPIESDDGRAAEQHLPGQALPQHAAERPDVAALVDVLAARLLRAHVGRRAEDHAGHRSGGGHRRRDDGSAPRLTPADGRSPWPGRSRGP